VPPSRQTSRTSLIPIERIDNRILLIRGRRVMLDADLAQLYGVSTKRLNEQVRRNADRFPDDFMLRLTAREAASLRSQIATLKTGRGRHRKYLPWAFTEHGAIMAATILNSRRAVRASILVVRAFVRLRQVLATHRRLAAKLAQLERRVGTHDAAIGELMDAIRRLMEPPPEPPRERIGFHPRPKTRAPESPRARSKRR
jgi:hypothetical protein